MIISFPVLWKMRIGSVDDRGSTHDLRTMNLNDHSFAMSSTLNSLLATMFLLCTLAVQAQPPNDNCWEAETFVLAPGVPALRMGTNIGATNIPPISMPQVWEVFTIEQCMDVAISYCGTSPAFQVILPTLYVGCSPSGFQNQVRHPNTGIDQTACPDGNYTIPFEQLAPGTYYFPVVSQTGSLGDYVLTFLGTACAATPPTNDVCSGAIPLFPNEACITVTGDVFGANAGVSLPAITCNEPAGDASDDVWFRFTATADVHTIIVSPSDLFNASVDLRSGTCGTTESIACSVAGGSGDMETIEATGLVIGDTYYIRVYDWYSGLALTTTFDICVIGPPAGDCFADAGMLSGGGAVCLDQEGTSLNATISQEATIPPGYTLTYLLTMGEELVLMGFASEPTFIAMMPGTYAIHTLVYDIATLDPDMFIPGEDTGSDLHGLLIQGGGSICGALDVSGTTFTVVECVPCEASAGTLSALSPSPCLIDGSATLEAIVGPDVLVPGAEYQHAFLLSQGSGQAIISVSLEPMYEVGSVGIHTIHSIVYDPATLDLGAIEFGTTTITDIHAILQQGGGTICASLDLPGAQFMVIDCTPPNDLCTLAQPLNVHELNACAGNETDGTTLFATYGEVSPVCDPSSVGYADVWYIFNSGENDQVFIDVIPGTITGWGVSVYTDCGGIPVLACDVEPMAPMLVNTMPDQEYLILVHTNLQTGQPGTFTICLTAEEAVNFCLGGSVSLNTGEEEIVLCGNFPSPPVTIVSAGIAAQNYAYVLTNDEGMIIQLMPGNTMDFNDMPLGVHHIHGVSYNGALTGVEAGSPVEGIGSTGDCVSLSENHVMVSVEICTGMEAMAGDHWTVFPNPATGEVTIQGIPRNGDVLLRLMDMGGRVVMTDRIRMNAGENHSLGLKGLAPGLYTVELSNEHERATLRLVVE
jgi:hypothetical protein